MLQITLISCFVCDSPYIEREMDKKKERGFTQSFTGQRTVTETAYVATGNCINDVIILQFCHMELRIC